MRRKSHHCTVINRKKVYRNVYSTACFPSHKTDSLNFAANTRTPAGNAQQFCVSMAYQEEKLSLQLEIQN
jgi:hypothetical protein